MDSQLPSGIRREVPYHEVVGGRIDTILAMCEDRRDTFGTDPASGAGMSLSGKAELPSGVRTPLPVDMGSGCWDWYRISNDLILSVTDARYRTDASVNTSLDDVVKIRFLMEGAIDLNFGGRRGEVGPSVLFSCHPAATIDFYRFRPSCRQRMVVLHCRRPFFDALLHRADDRVPAGAGARFVDGVTLPLVPELVTHMAPLLHSRSNGTLDPLYKSAKSIELLCATLEYAIDAHSDPRDRRQNDRLIVERTCALLLDNLMSPPNLDEIAAAVGTSRTRLTSCFRQATGLSVADYVHEHRMKLATSMLTHSHLPISEVAYRVGYDHPANFTAAFVRRFGVTPRNYRRGKD